MWIRKYAINFNFIEIDSWKFMYHTSIRLHCSTTWWLHIYTSIHHLRGSNIFDRVGSSFHCVRVRLCILLHKRYCVLCVCNTWTRFHASAYDRINDYFHCGAREFLSANRLSSEDDKATTKLEERMLARADIFRPSQYQFVPVSQSIFSKSQKQSRVYAQFAFELVVIPFISK